jgi:rhamnose transport system ATP-binding protein
VSFSLRPGQIIGLSGLVGSGRTALLETMAGVRPYQQGWILMQGRVLRPGSIHEALRAGIALLPEDRHRQGLFLGASVRGNIAMGTWKVFGAASEKRDQAVAAAAVKNLGIKVDSLDAPVTSLSGGNQQRVVLGRCLTNRPRVLLLDEPARGIDIAAKAEMYRFIGDLVSGGMAVVLASSELTEILGLADDIIVLHESRMVAELPRARATEQRLALLAGGGQDCEPGVGLGEMHYAAE